MFWIDLVASFAATLPSPTTAAAVAPAPEVSVKPTRRRRSVFLGPFLTGASAVVAATELGFSIFSTHRLASCTWWQDAGDCEDADAGALRQSVVLHRATADLATGLAAGAGWHLAWRRPAPLSPARERKLRRVGVALLVVGVAAEIAGYSMYTSFWMGSGSQRLEVPVVITLQAASLFRAFGIGASAFSWANAARR